MPRKPHDDSPEPSTYFEVQRNRDSVSEAGEARPGDVPRLPPESPWAAENQPEPLIDRSDDGDAMGTPIDQLP
jgi:hypothetical protein